MSTFSGTVDLSDKKGQYFLTGSQNFSMLKSIAESMAGRVGILTMETMTPLEMIDLGSEKGWLEAYLNQPDQLIERHYETMNFMKMYNQVIWRGSFPATVTFLMK